MSSKTKKKIAIISIIVLAVILIGSAFSLYYFKPDFSGIGSYILKKGITVVKPSPNQTVSSPLRISGYVNQGGWIGFEGQVGTVKILDDKDQMIALGILKATSEWTKPLVHFETILDFIPPSGGTGTLLFANENPSGLPDKEKEFRMPIKFSPSTETMKVKVYFNNSKLDPEASCNKTFAVDREIPKTSSVARASLLKLLEGPTDKEKSDGYFTSINTGVVIQKLTIEDGVAKVDFNDQLEFQVGGSCRVSAIRSEITQTLKQFSTVEQVVISINGRTEDILQP